MTAGKVEIVYLIRDVSQGRAIAEQDIEAVTVGGFNLPGNVIKKKSDVIGKYAAVDLKKMIIYYTQKFLIKRTMQMV